MYMCVSIFRPPQHPRENFPTARAHHCFQVDYLCCTRVGSERTLTFPSPSTRSVLLPFCSGRLPNQPHRFRLVVSVGPLITAVGLNLTVLFLLTWRYNKQCIDNIVHVVYGISKTNVKLSITPEPLTENCGSVFSSMHWVTSVKYFIVSHYFGTISKLFGIILELLEIDIPLTDWDLVCVGMKCNLSCIYLHVALLSASRCVPEKSYETGIFLLNSQNAWHKSEYFWDYSEKTLKTL